MLTGPTPEQRVLLLAPTGRDAELVSRVLSEAAIHCTACSDWTVFFRELDVGAAAAIMAEESLFDGEVSSLRERLERQPAWSDLPLLILAAPGADSPTVRDASRTLGNVTFLERPIRMAAFVSAARAALRARERQYQLRGQLVALHRSAVALRASEEQLRAADARKNEFLATLAHELRNPLAPLRNSLHVLRRKTGDTAVTSVQQIMERQLNALVRLVDDLLEVSRITRGKVDLHIDTLDLRTALQSAIETSRPLIEASQHTLILNIPREPLWVRGDALRLEQVFANLLNNAAKYTDENGTITLSARATDDEIVVSVADSGIGIEPEMLPYVFEMFTQVRGSARRAQGGLGIGLTLVQSLVDLHGGRVVARSEGLGRGSEFCVELKRAPKEGAVVRRPVEEPRAPQRVQRQVVVIDDNRDAADTLAMVLRLSGASVQVAYSAADGMRLLERGSNAVMLVDLGMPEMDGYELARRVRADPALQDVRLVALSGWGQTEDRARAIAAGFEYHLIKPADIGALTALLLSFDEELESERTLSRTGAIT